MMKAYAKFVVKKLYLKILFMDIKPGVAKNILFSGIKYK
jgi:hypothetical protein